MPRGRMMNVRRNARGEFAPMRRSRRGSMGGDYNYEYREYPEYGGRGYVFAGGDSTSQGQDMTRGRRDYESGGQSDMAGMDYADMRGRGGRDGHYPMGQGSTYFPIEAMGRFSGYWGEPQGDYGDMARGGRGRDRGDYNYDMRGRGRDYGYYDYGYEDYGDYGETLGKEELEKWNKKMMKDLEEKDKHFFSKENISQKAKQMGVQMDKFGEDELATASLLSYNTYCTALKPFVGANMDVYVSMGKAFLTDKTSSVKGAEKLAVYHDCIIEGEDD